jgi:Domain of unknown function (DUF932)
MQPTITGSFVQDQAHLTKSAKFVAIQPSQIAEALQPSGFELVSLKSGKAKNEDRQNHQTTIARYRSNHELTIGGAHMDLVFKVPHLYGSLQAFVGTYRVICSNGLVTGTKFFEAQRIRHQGDALAQLETLIPTLVSKHDQLVDTIQEMSARNVTPVQVAEFVREVAHMRLGVESSLAESSIKAIQYSDLMRVWRSADAGQDAFSVLNVVQENVMRFGLRYQTQTIDDQGGMQVRNVTARPVTRNGQGDTESVRSVDLNASIWDSAAKILMAA